MLEDVRWFNKYLLLLEYKKKHGNCNIDGNYVTEDGFRLGSWLKCQRYAYNKGILSEDKISFLRGLGIEFNISSKDAYWNKMYAVLKEYYIQNGNSSISTHADTDSVGLWINNLRRAYGGKAEYKLDKDRIALLNKIDFEWSKKDTFLLNSIIDYDNNDKYKKIMLGRMKHILEDLSYEIDGNITDKNKQKQIEKEIIKRMWR